MAVPIRVKLRKSQACVKRDISFQPGQAGAGDSPAKDPPGRSQGCQRPGRHRLLPSHCSLGSLPPPSPTCPQCRAWMGRGTQVRESENLPGGHGAATPTRELPRQSALLPLPGQGTRGAGLESRHAPGLTQM